MHMSDSKYRSWIDKGIAYVVYYMYPVPNVQSMSRNLVSEGHTQRHMGGIRQKALVLGHYPFCTSIQRTRIR